MLEELSAAVKGKDSQAFDSLFTRRCKAQCPGLMPHPGVRAGGYSFIRWLAPLSRREMMASWNQLLSTYDRVEEFRLTPHRVMTTAQRVRIRAALSIQGLDLDQNPRLDQGEVALVLVRQRGRWRIDSFSWPQVSSVWREDQGYELTPAVAGPPRPKRQQDLRIPGRSAEARWVAADVDGEPGPELIYARGVRVLALEGQGNSLKGPRLLFTVSGTAPIRALAAGDLDGDGRTDLFVGTYGGLSRIWLNRPEGFSALAGFAVAGNVTDALFTSLGGDPHADLYVVRHGRNHAMPWEPGQGNLLFLGGPGARMSRQKAAEDHGWGLGVCGGDLDSDGDVDLFVVNEFGPSRLWLNQGTAGFSIAGPRTGLAISALATACAVGDVNGDGQMDLFVGGRGASQAHLFGRPGQGTPGDQWGISKARQRRVAALATGGSFWINLSAGQQPQSGPVFRRAAMNRQDWVSWTGLIDHDQDGDLDLLLEDQRPAPQVEARWWWEVLGPILRRQNPEPLFVTSLPSRGVLLLNTGSNIWAPITRLAGLPKDAAPAMALVGNDADVRPGLVLQVGQSAPAGPNLRVARWQGEVEENHGVLLRLHGQPPLLDALGARVVLWTNGRQQVREVGLCSGVPGGPPGWVHFGVGEAVRVKEVRVRWPGGKVQRFGDLPVDRVVNLHQGGPALWADQD